MLWLASTEHVRKAVFQVAFVRLARAGMLLPWVAFDFPMLCAWLERAAVRALMFCTFGCTPCALVLVDRSPFSESLT